MLMEVFISHFLLLHFCFNYHTNKIILFYITGFSGAMFSWITSAKLNPECSIDIVFFKYFSHSTTGLPCLHSSTPQCFLR